MWTWYWLHIWQSRQILGLSSDAVGLCIFDVFAAHRCDCFLEKLDACGIKHVFVPAGSLQPLNVSINEPFKQHLKEIFSNWYAEQVKNSLEKDDLVEMSKLTLKLLKLSQSISSG